MTLFFPISEMIADPACLVYGVGVFTKKISSTMSVMSSGFWSGRILCSPAALIQPFQPFQRRQRQKPDQTCVGCVTIHQSSYMPEATRITSSKSYTALLMTMTVTKTPSHGSGPHFLPATYTNTFCQKLLLKNHHQPPTILTAHGEMVSRYWIPVQEISTNGRVSGLSALNQYLVPINSITSLARNHASIPRVWPDRWPLQQRIRYAIISSYEHNQQIRQQSQRKVFPICDNGFPQQMPLS